MAEMSTKYTKIKTIKAMLNEKELELYTLKEASNLKDVMVQKTHKDKEHLQEELSNSSTKFIGRDALYRARCILWD